MIPVLKKAFTRKLLPFYILMFLYVVLRAHHVYLTCDEGWTLSEYLNESFFDIAICEKPVANNHILNTLLVKICSGFSLSLLSIRLPNVLACLLYFYATAGIAGIYFKDKRTLYYCLILVLSLNPALYAFFAYARGYGISIAFLMLAVYNLMLAYEKNKHRKHIHIAFIALLIGVYANFVLLNVVAPFFLLAMYIIYIKENNSLRPAIIIAFLYSAILILLVAYPMLRLINAQELYWGGITNYISDTLASLVEDLLSLKRWTITWAIALCIFLLLLVGSLIILIKGFSGLKSDKRNLSIYMVPAILLFCTLSLNLQFYLLDVHLLKHRTALFLYPVCVLTIFSAIRLYAGHRPKWALRISVGLVVILTLAFVRNMNISESDEWAYNAFDQDVIAEIEKDAPTGTATLYADKFYGVCINYYLLRDNNTKIAPTPIMDIQDITQFHYDYLYIFSEQAKYVPTAYSLHKSYDGGKYLLYKK